MFRVPRDGTRGNGKWYCPENSQQMYKTTQDSGEVLGQDPEQRGGPASLGIILP